MPIDEPDDRPGPPFISTLTPIERREFEPTFASGELVFGRYEVVRMLGKGGMGIVYLVRRPKEQQRRTIAENDSAEPGRRAESQTSAARGERSGKAKPSPHRQSHRF